MDEPLIKDDQYWRDKLSDEEYRICREKGTERAFSGEYWNVKRSGVYVCRCCNNALFDANTKYDSHSGWPSFYTPIRRDLVEEHPDHSLAMSRVEIVCSKCNCHLGHVFPDGPQPTGRRYCVNSASLNFIEDEPE